MKFLIIGLGVYGYNLAIDLSDVGSEVIGVDNRQSAVDAIKDYISTAYILDATDENAMDVLPLKNIDTAIVAIGDNFGASIKTTALLKKMGLKRIYVRAIDSLHEAILEGMNIDKILTPEKNSAFELVNEMTLGYDVTAFKVDKTHYIVRFHAPQLFIGTFYSELYQNESYGLKLIAACRTHEEKNIIGMKTMTETVFDSHEPGSKVEEGDILTFYGPVEKFRHLLKLISD